MLPELMPGGPVIDELAILIAVSGDRPVTLTRAERLLAIGLIIAAGGSAALAARRTGLTEGAVSKILARVRNTIGPEAGTAAVI